jgi:hypothetical protein
LNNQIQLRLTGPPNANDPEKGKWLTATEVRQMLDFVKIYLGTGPISDNAAYAFDKHLYCNFSAVKALIENKQERRYAAKLSQVSNLEKWAQIIERQFLTSLNPIDAGTRFLRCPTEVGWSENIYRRLIEHGKGQGSTPVFEFARIYTQFSLPAPDRFPEIKTFTLFRVWRDDVLHCRVGEFTGTLLTSSLIEHGGLNPALPGNIHPVKYTSNVTDENVRAIFTRDHIETTVEGDMQVMKDKHEFLSYLDQHVKDIDAMTTECKKLDQQRKDLQETIKGLKEQDEQLDEELKALKDQILTIPDTIAMKGGLLAHLSFHQTVKGKGRRPKKGAS